MRSEKELWELVLSRTYLFETGLCRWVSKLKMHGLINTLEVLTLENALESGAPAAVDIGFYYWPPFKIEPRIDWIKNRIKQLGDENKS